jgi:two-component system, sensor histidine kinase
MAKQRTAKRAPVRARRGNAARPRRAPQSARTRAVELMVAGLAHDVRTPLTGILAASELLASAELGEREQRWVAALISSAKHLEALTTLVVDGVRLSGRDLVLRHDPFDPRELAQDAGASLAARVEAAKLAGRLDVAADLPGHVIGDAVRLRAALENLIENGVKFTKQGEVSLGVTSQNLTRGRVRLSFAVTDSGIGMSPAEMQGLFRPFTQASEVIAQRFGGAGLGLALVKRLAKAMGGDLKVASRRGRGSTFTLSVVVPKEST